jgi:hypothetical protein
MNHTNPLVLVGIGGLALNFVIGTNVNMRIKGLLKALYPKIWETIGVDSIAGSSINTSLTLMKIINNPPSEITYNPLLRLFTIWKILVAIQMVIMIATVLVGILGPKY